MFENMTAAVAREHVRDLHRAADRDRDRRIARVYRHALRSGRKRRA